MIEVLIKRFKVLRSPRQICRISCLNYLGRHIRVHNLACLVIQALRAKRCESLTLQPHGISWAHTQKVLRLRSITRLPRLKHCRSCLLAHGRA